MEISTHQHSFVELPSSQKRGGYFKQLPGGNYDQSMAYAMLYCPECGETKEVVAADHVQSLPGFPEVTNNF